MVEKIGKCGEGCASTETRVKPGIPGSGAIGRMEKSSEIDSTGLSDVRRPISVTGAPSICETTQIQMNATRTMQKVPVDQRDIAIRGIEVICQHYTGARTH